MAVPDALWPRNEKEVSPMVKSDIPSPEVSGNTDSPQAYVYAITAKEQAVKHSRRLESL
jgi:hypothetical protein